MVLPHLAESGGIFCSLPLSTENLTIVSLWICKNQADGGVVVLAAFKFVEHSYIGIHLPDVLMGQLIGFEVNQHKTLEQVVVEHQVNVKVVGFRTDAVLFADK